MPSATRKIFLGAAALGAIAVGVVPGTAQAATTASGTFRLCNVGTDYSVYATFPDRGGFSSYVLSYGQCWNGDIGPSEAFYLNVRRANNSEEFSTYRDYTNNAPSTVVTTQNTFTSFTYVKQ
ncbi:hypothetical protein ACFWY9_38525 [Amycolatopsis sp. NPDC059027]|uniref:hypothetical protein n=1 Tax=Amycolatopsis sp. NPDC059027 TaxID=3346709 RepID=UPI0036705D6B